ncbi:hypothetical protein [Nocardia carnea]|uniref:hypothetical protein n=1 Tax=Nocardia carnea TaxID=37328 RepID=UPI00245901D0|nr:hypothetical protein [Nocardia carnea]
MPSNSPNAGTTVQADPEAEPAANSAEPDQGDSAPDPEADPDPPHAATAAGVVGPSPATAGFGPGTVRSRAGRAAAAVELTGVASTAPPE